MYAGVCVAGKNVCLLLRHSLDGYDPKQNRALLCIDWSVFNLVRIVIFLVGERNAAFEFPVCSSSLKRAAHRWAEHPVRGSGTVSGGMGAVTRSGALASSEHFKLEDPHRHKSTIYKKTDTPLDPKRNELTTHTRHWISSITGLFIIFVLRTSTLLSARKLLSASIMSIDPNLRRISPSTLKSWIDSSDAASLAIVDVRDGDHVGVSEIF